MHNAAHAQQLDDLWLVLPHLGAGGAQKVALMAASFFLAKGWRVRLVTLRSGSAQAHTIPEGLLVNDLAPVVDAMREEQILKCPWQSPGLRVRTPQWALHVLHRLIALLVMGPLVGLLQPVQPGQRCWRSRLLCWCMTGIGGPPSWALERLL